MASNDAKRLGYGASAEIDGVQVLVTSGNFDTSNSISYLDMLNIVPTVGASRSRTKHADGTASYGVSISFDVTTDFLSILTTAKLFSRGYAFDIGLDDGEDAQEITDCLVQSLSLSGAAGGLITASMTATGITAPATSLLVKNDYIRAQKPLGYWYSGNTDVRDWSLTMNQAVTPVYINKDVVTPRYLKYGLLDFSLQVTTYEAVVATSVINIATSAFTLTGNTASQGFAFVGVTELGNYTHLFETSADITVGSGDIIIT